MVFMKIFDFYTWRYKYGQRNVMRGRPKHPKTFGNETHPTLETMNTCLSFVYPHRRNPTMLPDQNTISM